MSRAVAEWRQAWVEQVARDRELPPLSLSVARFFAKVGLSHSEADTQSGQPEIIRPDLKSLAELATAGLPQLVEAIIALARRGHISAERRRGRPIYRFIRRDKEAAP
jgi:hypothetical protein